jgi:pyrroline-5-carboxylate reductase
MQPSLDRHASTGVHTTASNIEVVSRSQVVFLAVKPDVVAAVLDEIKDVLGQDHLLIR